jgi:predicted enzyme related to lactoylglutathione lyase
MSSLVIFSVHVRRVAAFYGAVLGAKPHDEPSGDIRLIGDREEVLIQVRTPPERREGAAIKPVFDVESLEAALEQVEAKGGVVTAMTFSIDGLTRHDVLDPDGNVIQLRGRTAAF